MIKISPRFFVLPLLALAIILSLPRPGEQATCGTETAAAASSMRQADGKPCAPQRQRLAMTPAALTR
jgi:hypothetical protein